MKKVQLFSLALLCLPVIVFAQRDPLKWPFAKTSIWNMPIHNNAVYVPANIQPANNFEADEDVIIMQPNEPAIPINLNTAGWGQRDRCTIDGAALFGAPIANNYIFDNTVWYGRTPNAGAAILLPNGKIKQTQPFAKCSTGYATSQFVWSENLCELTGECIQGAHGGSGLSAIGGTVRVGELTAGVIKHALKINLWGKENFYRLNGGYRWPAVKADGGYNDSTAFNYYGGTNPEMRIGALLAIYKDAVLNSVTDNSLGIETEAGLIFARALRDYGAYTVDNTAWDSYAFVIENGPDGIVRNEFKTRFGYDMNVFGSLNNSAWGRDLKRLFSNLYVIANNTGADNIGGGPSTDFINRRAPMAPDFTSTNPQRVFKIMPLGDSKTEGGGGSGQSSWRGFLRTKLTRAGYTIDYVGDRSNTAAGDTIPPDYNHAGHGGYTIGPDIAKFCSSCETTGLYEHIQDWLPPADPDVVLLSVGVNDMFGASSHPPNYARTAPERYSALVDKILQLKPTVKIILGTVEPVKWDVNWGGNPNDNNLGALNAKIKAIADSSLTDNIFFADIRNKMLVGFGPADFWDDLHLSAHGANKAADGWLEAVVPVLNNVPDNIAPSINITSPVNNASFAAPASITITSNATDTDGGIAKVAFYNRAVKIGEDSTAPYSITWQNVDEGTYQVHAVATDVYFATTTSSPVTVTVGSTDGYIKFGGTGIGSAGSYNNNGYTYSNALDSNVTTYFDGASANGQWVGLDLGIAKRVKKVKYVPRSGWASRIAGGKIQGANSADFSDATDLFTITQTPLEAVYSTARFTNTRFFQYYRFLSPAGGYGNIAEIEFWGDPNDPVNLAPACNLFAPTNNSVFSTGADIFFTATASDADGTVSKVDFYQGNVLIGTATSAPYNFVWSNVAAGSYIVTAKASDDAGVIKSSQPVSIKVNATGTGPVLYAENFDTNTSSGWVVNNGTWAATTLKYRGSNSGGEYTSYYNGASFSNYTLTIDALATFANDAGVMFNYQNASNYYFFVFNSDKKTASLKRRLNGTITTLVSGAFTGRGIGTTHTIYIKNTGSLTTIKINDITICENLNTTTFANGKIGVYSYFTPTAFDNVMVVANNELPVITITSPSFHSIFTQPVNVPVTVSLTDPENTLARVDYYNGAVLIGSVSSAPYQLNLDNVAAGNYFITAKAIHSNGFEITSSVVSLTINPAGSEAPAVNITTPATNVSIEAPATISIAATAADTDGAVTKVDFYSGNALIGSDTTSPYEMSWPNIKAGTYNLMARATDNVGAVSNSAIVNVLVVHPAPIVTIATPKDTITGFEVPLTALASTTDGTISKVEFYNDTTLLGSVSTSPYNFTWKAPAGTYNLTSKAIDNVGASSISAPVTVKVNGYPEGVTNLLQNNPGFEAVAGINYANGAYNAIPGWSLFNAAFNSIGVSNNNAAEGNRKLQIIQAGYGETAPANFADVSPGNVYALTISLRKIASRNTAVSSPAQLLLKWYDSTGVFVNSVTTGNILGGPVTGWETYTITGTVPANAYKASGKINVNLGTSPNTGLADFHVDHFVLYKIADAQPPLVNITSPLTDTLVTAPATVTLRAAATDNDGTISKVEFYNGNTLLGSDVTAPYTYNWTNVSSGIYSISAKAIDNHNLSAISSAVNITVNSAPEITLLSPAGGNVANAPAAIVFEATATDADGTITKVDYYSGSTLLGTISSTPYIFTWNNVAAGTYTLTAKATDDRGTVTTTPERTVIINSVPEVTISSPANNTVFLSNPTITISANATDADGSIEKVDFYHGSTLLGTINNSPFNFSWANVPSGTYQLTAKATDNNGAFMNSAPVTIIVNATPLVQMTAPTHDTVIQVPATVYLAAAASDIDGHVTKVKFFIDDSLVHIDYTAPYEFYWYKVKKEESGQHILTAKAFDNTGDSSVSQSILTIYHPSQNSSNYVGRRSRVASDSVSDYTHLKAYPNPFSNGIMILEAGGFLNNELLDVEVTDMYGRKVFAKKLMAANNGSVITTLSRSQFYSKGIYVITIKSKTNSQLQKIIVE